MPRIFEDGYGWWGQASPGERSIFFGPHDLAYYWLLHQKDD